MLWKQLSVCGQLVINRPPRLIPPLSQTPWGLHYLWLESFYPSNPLGVAEDDQPMRLIREFLWLPSKHDGVTGVSIRLFSSFESKWQTSSKIPFLLHPLILPLAWSHRWFHKSIMALLNPTVRCTYRPLKVPTQLGNPSWWFRLGNIGKRVPSAVMIPHRTCLPHQCSPIVKGLFCAGG